jgi:hypothetical protein
MSVFTEEFLVLGPSDPLVALLDGDVTLPCSVSPVINVENMEFRWFRTKFSEAVFIYQNQWEQNEEQMAEYAGRTSLVRDFLTQGEAAVKIHKVRVSDNGMYTCFFKKGAFYEEAKLEVKVAGWLLHLCSRDPGCLGYVSDLGDQVIQPDILHMEKSYRFHLYNYLCNTNTICEAPKMCRPCSGTRDMSVKQRYQSCGVYILEAEVEKNHNK